eukprot:evm.model.scf_135.13 EVM.evm.TU.scf_135.13   scf_135:112002-117936(-)
MAKENESQLVITPSELKFRFQLGKNIPTTISLSNPTSVRFAFKVKTTSPKKYCVRPSSGFILPNSTKDVEIIMQSQKEYPSDLGNCRDKFLVQSVPAPDGDEATSDLFDKSKNKEVRESKLRVQLEGPPAPPSPIPENSSEEEPLLSNKERAPERFASANVGVHVPKDTKDIASELEKARRERDMFKSKVDNIQQSSSAAQMNLKNGFSLIQLILVALIAFLLGHYTS